MQMNKKAYQAVMTTAFIMLWVLGIMVNMITDSIIATEIFVGLYIVAMVVVERKIEVIK